MTKKPCQLCGAEYDEDWGLTCGSTQNDSGIVGYQSKECRERCKERELESKRVAAMKALITERDAARAKVAALQAAVRSARHIIDLVDDKPGVGSLKTVWFMTPVVAEALAMKVEG
jgi:hypothetical protein